MLKLFSRFSAILGLALAIPILSTTPATAGCWSLFGNCKPEPVETPVAKTTKPQGDVVYNLNANHWIEMPTGQKVMISKTDPASCLGKVIYYEDPKSQKETAQVVMNRQAVSGQSVCSEVHKPWAFEPMAREDVDPIELEDWEDVKKQGEVALKTGGAYRPELWCAVNFHSSNPKAFRKTGRFPSWPDMVEVGRHGDHIFFCSWKDLTGLAVLAERAKKNGIDIAALNMPDKLRLAVAQATNAPLLAQAPKAAAPLQALAYAPVPVPRMRPPVEEILAKAEAGRYVAEAKAKAVALDRAQALKVAAKPANWDMANRFYNPDDEVVVVETPAKMALNIHK